MDEMQIEEQHAARSSETMLDLNDSGINELQGLSSDSELGTKLDLAKPTSTWVTQTGRSARWKRY
jgi:hypothetical protein